MSIDKLPDGFLAAGRNVGIKTSKRDMGILISDTPAVFAACVTTNKSRAPCAARTARIRTLAKPVRAIVAVSGNANALTGAKGIEDDEALARAVAEQLHVGADEILTASTGVLGHRMPLEKIIGGLTPLLAGLSGDPQSFAESVMTTDWVKKLSTRDVFIEGQRVRIHGVAKGSGMIAPALATSLCFITTDARIRREALVRALEEGVAGTLNQLTVDGDMSTNDQIFALANGWAENKEILAEGENFALFAAGLEAVLRELARAIADDGEGATRLLEVKVQNAASLEDARVISRTIAGSMLVKAAIYGGDSYAWGRIIGAAGAAAARANAAFDLDRLSVDLQNIRVFDKGVAAEGAKSAQLRHKMAEPDIYVTLDLGTGSETACAWGCDLSYDYVKVNADYAAATATQADGTVAVNERLAELGPSIKKKLLIEALRYIDRFKGIRAVIKIGGEAMVDPRLEEQFAEDVLLLRSVGLLPVVVHGGGPEISKTLERLGIASEFSDGLRVTDASSMPVVEMVLSGSVNQRLVAALNKNGSRAVGLSGKDGGLIRAKKWGASERDLGRVGEVVSVNTALIDMLEKDGYIPVISPVGLGEQGTAYNLSADVVAAELGRGLRAEKLVFLSDEPGLVDPAGQVISELDSDQLKARIDRGELGTPMRPKLDACLRALAHGVASVHLVDGRVPHNLIAELFTERGVGTLDQTSVKMIHPKSYLTELDLSADETRKLLEDAAWLKRERMMHADLAGKHVALYFEKPSVRTRVSFTVAAHELGGQVIELGPSNTKVGKGEEPEDFAKVIGRYVSVLVARVFAQDKLERMAEHAGIPVINALSDERHPCQALADVLTIIERRGKIEDQRIAFVGEGNNVATSLALLATALGAKVVVASPERYGLPAIARHIEQTDDVEAAVRDADVLYTDTWISMGQEAEAEARRRAFTGYKIDRALLARAKSDAIVMHCLPAVRGEEIDTDVMYSEQSAIWDQAENRLHVQKALLRSLASGITR